MLQPCDRTRQLILLMLALLKPVTFLWIEHRLHCAALALQDSYHLLRFLSRHSDVALSLQNQQGAVSLLTKLVPDPAKP